jgi:hypothetical protein
LENPISHSLSSIALLVGSPANDSSPLCKDICAPPPADILTDEPETIDNGSPVTDLMQWSKGKVPGLPEPIKIVTSNPSKTQEAISRSQTRTNCPYNRYERQGQTSATRCLLASRSSNIGLKTDHFRVNNKVTKFSRSMSDFENDFTRFKRKSHQNTETFARITHGNHHVIGAVTSPLDSCQYVFVQKMNYSLQLGVIRESTPNCQGPGPDRVHWLMKD